MGKKKKKRKKKPVSASSKAQREITILNEKLRDDELIALFEGATPKMVAFFLLWLKDGNATEAAMQAYNCKNRNVARALGCKTLAKVSHPLKLYAEANGLDIPYAMKKLREGMEATKMRSTRIVLTKTGKRREIVKEVPDFTERGEWWDRLAKIMGWVKETPQSVMPVQFNIGTDREKYG